MHDAGSTQPNFSLLVSRYSGSNQWDRALETAREWLGVDSENPRAHAAAGQALINLGREAQAEPHIRRVLQREPENDFALRLLSIVCFKLGRFKEADEAIHRAISIDPQDAFHWYHLGQMCHSQGDIESTRRCAVRARELRPRDANIANLFAMCERGDAVDPAAQLRRYREALELDPESAIIHNNIGVYHLNVEKDYAAAEACFRRALHFEPSRPLFRSNLFITLKHRDPVYRFLCWPRELFTSFTRSRGSLGIVIYVCVAIAAARVVAIVMLFWLIFVWPLVKIYERLTIGDIRAKAGEVGARSGGLFGYRRWPLYVRLSLFAAILVGFWGSVTWFARDEQNLPFLVFLGICAGIAYLVHVLIKGVRNNHRARVAKRRARRFHDLLVSPVKRSSRLPPPIPASISDE